MRRSLAQSMALALRLVHGHVPVRARAAGCRPWPRPRWSGPWPAGRRPGTTSGRSGCGRRCWPGSGSVPCLRIFQPSRRPMDRRRAARRGEGAAVAQVGDGDGVDLAARGGRDPHRVLVAAVPGLPDGAEPVDDEVVGDVGPAPGALVEGLDRPEHRGHLALAVAVRVHRVVDDAPGDAGVEARRAPVRRGAPGLAHRWIGGGRVEGRRSAPLPARAAASPGRADEVDDDVAGVGGQPAARSRRRRHRPRSARGRRRAGGRSNQAVQPVGRWARTRPSRPDGLVVEAPIVVKASMPSARPTSSTGPRAAGRASASSTA